MAISTQVRTLRALRSILAGNGAGALPVSAEPKPVFKASAPAIPLPRSTPEAEGLSSHMLESLYREMAATPNVGAHSLLVQRHGKIISEGYFSPFRPGIWHVTHSLCKTFTGTAVGIAIHEGLLSLEDTAISFFPDKAGILPGRKLRSISVRHLLTMSSGISYNEISEAVDTDWLKGIFSSSVAFEPGSRFSYNSMNSFLLSAIIQAVSGQTLMEFLTPRLFEPMGFGPVAFEKSSDGIEKGGWGMYITLEDMAKFGQLYLNKGSWVVNGTPSQLVPKKWVEQATQCQIVGEHGEQYGYHIWVDGEATIMNGMFGQYVVLLPKQKMAVTMTAGNPHLFIDSPAHELVRKTFYKKQFPTTLPQNPHAYRSLCHTTSALRFNRRLQSKDALPRPVRKTSRAHRWQRIVKETKPEYDTAAFLNTTWGFPKNNGGLLPVILQVTNNNFSTGVQALRIEKRDSTSLTLFWEEDAGTICLPLGLQAPIESTITIGRETFEIAAFCEVRHNEDDEPVLKIEIALLEHSSCRFLKLRLGAANRLHVSMDEQPALLVAIESVLAQAQATTAPDAKADPAEALLNLDYVNQRLQKLCTPNITGEPVLNNDR